jgi:hypothetical protein
LFSELPIADFNALLNNDLLIATSVVIKQSVVAIFGAIIPAPLTVAAIVISVPEILSRCTACFGFGSVVIIDFAKSSPALEEAESFAAALEIPAVILLIGSCSPMIPVEATKTLCGSSSICPAVLLHIFTALAIPNLPVQALALPELTTTAYTRGLLMCFLQICTAAETILFVVKTAAALAPLGQTINPKSRLPDSLIPHAVPDAKKPFGEVTVLFAILRPVKEFSCLLIADLLLFSRGCQVFMLSPNP